MPHAPVSLTYSYAATERRVTTFPFEKYLGHGFSDDDDDGMLEGHVDGAAATLPDLDMLPEGARLQLDVLSAKDATLRRTRFLVSMECMPGRETAAGGAHLGAAPGAYTNHLPLPDPDLDAAASTHRRVHQVQRGKGGYAGCNCCLMKREDQPGTPSLHPVALSSHPVWSTPSGHLVPRASSYAYSDHAIVFPQNHYCGRSVLHLFCPLAMPPPPPPAGRPGRFRPPAAGSGASAGGRGGPQGPRHVPLGRAHRGDWHGGPLLEFRPVSEAPVRQGSRTDQQRAVQGD